MRRAALILVLLPAWLSASDQWLFRSPPGFDSPDVVARTDPGPEHGPQVHAGMPVSERSLTAWRNQAAWLAERLGKRGLRIGNAVHIRIFKQTRELELYIQRDDRFELYRTFPICEMSGTLGPKRFEGDYQAPEGFYSVRPERMHPHSDFHLAFNVGYPNAHDRARNRTGANIMIHGGCASNGCFAMSDYYMEQLYVLAEAAFRNGQRQIGVEIYPFRMSEANLRAHAGSRWIRFWETLKPLHDHFEAHRRPALVHAGARGYRAAPEPEYGKASISAP